MTQTSEAYATNKNDHFCNFYNNFFYGNFSKKNLNYSYYLGPTPRIFCKSSCTKTVASTETAQQTADTEIESAAK